MGGVWRWIFFSHGFQLAFTLKTVFKALDRDLHFVHYYVWGNRPSFVHTWSCPTYSITSLKSHPLLYSHQWYPLIFSALWTALDLVSDQWANSMCILNFTSHWYHRYLYAWEQKSCNPSSGPSRDFYCRLWIFHAKNISFIGYELTALLNCINTRMQITYCRSGNLFFIVSVSYEN